MNDAASALLALAGAAALIAWIVRWERRRDRARTEELRSLASTLGWWFEPALDSSYPAASAFVRGRDRGLFNTLHHEFQVGDHACRVRCGDFRFIVPTGRSSARIVFSYVTVESPYPRTPSLLVRREDALDKLAEVFGGDDIDLESDAFSRRFRVRCEDRRFAWDFLHPKMMELLMHGPDEAVEVSHGFVTLTNGNRQWRPDEFQLRVAFVKEFFARWPTLRKGDLS